MLRMYEEFADWWPLLSAPADYVDDAAFYRRVLTEAGAGSGGTLLEWTWDPDPRDDTDTVDCVFVFREADGTVRVEHDRHIEGLFARATWLRLLGEAGFEDARAVPLEHPEVDPHTHEVFVVGRPRA